ncbi:cellulase family glycosylhydrolase [Ralstonia sp. ASV6]|uniref:cellulase family glycosylhydrolase n=1 Tax=Ralstonia sp. ASV6 TaxID=2795124 RepID=UPI0018EA9536|nr:cellulase family glycosylhydrolase [Ralstonia sp. ASV6]
MRCLMRWLLACALALATSGAVSETIAGACIHPIRKNADLPAIKAALVEARLASWRTSLPWNELEKRKGEYAISAPLGRVVEMIEWASATGRQPLLLLGYGNNLYEPGGLVTTDAAREGFTHYASWVARRMKGKVRYYEIWNEWNIGFGSTTKPRTVGSVEDYAKLVSVTAQAIRAADPQAIILAGGATNSDTRWFEAFARTGAADAVDGISIHPYNYGKPLWGHSPEAAIAWVDEIHRLMLDAHGKPIDMYVTEMGWPTHRGGYTEADAADYLQRFMALAKARPYMKGVWWYDLIDDGDDPTNREHRFGLFGRDGRAKPTARRYEECCGRAIVDSY